MKMLDTLLSGNYGEKSEILNNNERPANSNSDLTDAVQQDSSILTQKD